MFWKLLLMLFLQVHKDRGQRANIEPIDDWLSEEEPARPDLFSEECVSAFERDYTSEYL